MRYSYTKIATYKDCALKFKYAYIDNIKPLPSSATIRGEFMHKILENIGVDVSYEKMEYVTDNIQLPQDLDIKQAQNALESIKKWFTLERFHNIVAVEKFFELNIGDYVLVGKIDRIDRLFDNTYEVIDYKTGHTNNYDLLQLNIYALATYKLFNADEVIVRFEYIDTGETRRYSTQKQQSDEFERILIDYMSNIQKSIDSNDFPPNVAPRCRTCLFRDMCTAYNTSQNKIKS
ncbi:MAG: PD-(D/E)XK nuclease family protein [Candidatus Parvarchaeum sp.]